MKNSGELKNQDATMMLQRAMAFFQQGDVIQAEKIVTKVLKSSPDHVPAIQLLGGIKSQNEDYLSAFKLFSRAVKLNPEQSNNYNNLGYVLHMMGKLDDAQRACLNAIRLNPVAAGAHNTLAVVLKDQGDLEQALSMAQRAINLKSDFIEAYNTMAVVLREAGEIEKALSICRRALQIRPDFIEIHNLMVIVLTHLNRFDEATMACDYAIRLCPDFAVLYDTLGNLLSEQGRLLDALAAYDVAIVKKNSDITSYYNRGNTYSNLGRFEDAIKDYRNVIRLKPQHAEAHSNLLFAQASMATLPYPEMLKQQKQWDKVHGKEGRSNITSTGLRKKREGERLRIGYISADFCMHPVGFFIEPLLACHDKAKVEVFCYANMRESQADEITHRLCAVSDHWRFIGERNDVELVKIIQQDEIDVLVDLAGHTRGNRLKVFTYRPAPVQAMYLGYCASSGLQAMDYWITDDILHPPDTPELSTEQIVRLPRCSFCYQPPLNVAIKDSLGRDTDTVVFASYSNLSKLLPDVIATWSKILTAVGGSRLMIMDKYMADEATRKVLLDQFRDNGISADRLMIKGNLPYADYYSSYSDVDIVLDPFPRTGGTTTADALWMGVPVITLAGQRYVERISAAKLCTLGLEELVADNEDQYISIAVKLSDDEDYRMRLRKSLRDRMRESQLCDGKGLAEAMEAAYRKMVDCL